MSGFLDELEAPDDIPEEEHEKQVRGVVSRKELNAENCGGGDE